MEDAAFTNKLGLNRLTVDKQFYSRLVGVSFPNPDGTKRTTHIRKCRVCDDLLLVPQPENQFDRYAIAVTRGTGEQIGFLDRRCAGEVSRSLASGRVWWAFFAHANHHPPESRKVVGCVIYLARRGEPEVKVPEVAAGMLENKSEQSAELRRWWQRIMWFKKKTALPVVVKPAAIQSPGPVEMKPQQPPTLTFEEKKAAFVTQCASGASFDLLVELLRPRSLLYFVTDPARKWDEEFEGGIGHALGQMIVYGLITKPPDFEDESFKFRVTSYGAVLVVTATQSPEIKARARHLL